MALSPLEQTVRLNFQEINNIMIDIATMEEEEKSLHGRLNVLDGLKKNKRQKIYNLVARMADEVK